MKDKAYREVFQQFIPRPFATRRKNTRLDDDDPCSAVSAHRFFDFVNDNDAEEEENEEEDGYRISGADDIVGSGGRREKGISQQTKTGVKSSSAES